MLQATHGGLSPAPGTGPAPEMLAVGQASVHGWRDTKPLLPALQPVPAGQEAKCMKIL